MEPSNFGPLHPHSPMGRKLHSIGTVTYREPRARPDTPAPCGVLKCSVPPMITSTPPKPAEASFLSPARFTEGELPSAPPTFPAASGIADICVEVSSTSDIVTARQRGRMLALQLGFPGQDVTLIAAAVSEVARNIVDHAEAGEIIFRAVHEAGRSGLEIVAHDEGPGISDASRLSDYGFMSGSELGSVGLPGVRLLMDDFQIESTVGRGTTVTMKKWLR